MQRKVSSGAWWLNPTAGAVAAIAPAIVAVFVLAHQLTLHGVLHGVVIGNESQNFASSIALTNGALPYSNFPLAAPPGMTVLMLPFAWLSHFAAQSLAMSLARGATAIVTVAAAYLTGFNARGYGVPATVLAGVFAATYPLEFFSTAGVTTGPYILLFVMIAMALAFRPGELASGGRMFFAGLFLGYACTIKPWAFIPAIVLVGCALAAWHDRRDHLLPVLGGLVVGIVVPCIVFFLAAPSTFWREVVTTELPGHGTMAAGAKVATVLGLGGAAGFSHPNGMAVTVAIVVMAAILVVAFAGVRTSSTYDWFVTLTSVAVLGAAFIPGAMSVQYGEFALPFVAIGVAVTASRLLGLLAASGSGRPTDTRASLAMAAAILIVGCAAVVTAVSAPADGKFGASFADTHGAITTGAITGTIPAGGCAISNNPMILVAGNRFSENGSSCPVTVDPTGVMAIDHGRGGRHADVEQWIEWLRLAHYVVLVDPVSDVPIDGRVARFLRDHYAVILIRPHIIASGRSDL